MNERSVVCAPATFVGRRSVMLIGRGMRCSRLPHDTAGGLTSIAGSVVSAPVVSFTYQPGNVSIEIPPQLSLDQVT